MVGLFSSSRTNDSSSAVGMFGRVAPSCPSDRTGVILSGNAQHPLIASHPRQRSSRVPIPAMPTNTRSTRDLAPAVRTGLGGTDAQHRAGTLSKGRQDQDHKSDHDQDHTRDEADDWIDNDQHDSHEQQDEADHGLPAKTSSTAISSFAIATHSPRTWSKRTVQIIRPSGSQTAGRHAPRRMPPGGEF